MLRDTIRRRQAILQIYPNQLNFIYKISFASLFFNIWTENFYEYG